MATVQTERTTLQENIVALAGELARLHAQHLDTKQKGEPLSLTRRYGLRLKTQALLAQNPPRKCRPYFFHE